MHSLLPVILGLVLVAQTRAHVSIISIYGSNDLVGHAFGVDTNGKYPRVKGAPGDAGGDSGLFQTGTDNPSPACGSTPELGPLDIPAWLDQAEGFGLPAAYSNKSIVFEVFQVNRDGGGPMSCEFNEDATATSWRPMFISLNQAGNSGIENQQRVNSTVVANFPADASCTGGFTQTACIVRCRTGVNQRFGGCFAAKLDGSVPFAATVSTDMNLKSTTISSASANVSSVSDGALSDQALDRIAQTIIVAMQSNGFLISAAAVGTIRNSSLSVSNSSSGAISRLVDTSQTISNTSTGLPTPNVISGVFGNNSTDSTNATDAASTAPGTFNSTDASDIADAMTAANATDASDVADAEFDQGSNQTKNSPSVANTMPSSNATSDDSNSKQISPTSKVIPHHSRRYSCTRSKKHRTIQRN